MTNKVSISIQSVSKVELPTLTLKPLVVVKSIATQYIVEGESR